MATFLKTHLVFHFTHFFSLDNHKKMIECKKTFDGGCVHEKKTMILKKLNATSIFLFLSFLCISPFLLLLLLFLSVHLAFSPRQLV